MTAFSVPANLAFESYDELIETINDWLDRSDLTGSAPSMIALCEARLRRKLSPLEFEKTASLSVSAGVSSLPSDFTHMRMLTYEGTPIDEVSPTIGRQYEIDTAPRGYSLEAGGLRVWPSFSGVVEALYQSSLESLSSANQSNLILLEHPDCYFFGSMMFAEGYLANDSRATLFKGLWDESLEELRAFLRRQRRDRPRLRNPAVIA